MSAAGSAAPVESAQRRLSLHEIMERMLAVLERIDADDGEVTDETAVELDLLTESIGQRVEAYAGVCRTLEAEADACDELAQPYLERARRKRAKAAELKRRLHVAMVAIGERKISTPTVTASIQRNGAPRLKLLIAEHEIGERVPEELLDRKPTLRAVELKQRLAAGETFDFAELEFGDHLRFR